MESPITRLKNRLLRKGPKDSTRLNSLVDVGRHLSCIGEIIGRDYEVRDPKGELLCTIRQKPMAIKQMNVLSKELHTLLKRDQERENKKWSKGKR